VLVSGFAHLASAESYRRWLAPKTFTCSHGAGSASAALNNQDVEFSDLPVGAQFTINYVDNGVTTTSGPFGVELTTGTFPYASFAEPSPSCPFAFDFRIDTIVNGQVVYRSSINIACSADASGSATIVNDIGPLPTTTTTTTTSTTSTTLPAGCAEAASITSIDCRLGALLEDAAVVTLDDALRAAIVESTTQARDAVRASGAAATPRARKRLLRRADKALAKVAATVRRAGGALDAQRPSLLRTVAGLRSDLLVLRSTPG